MLKFPETAFGGDAEHYNALAGINAIAYSENIIDTREFGNFKDRFAERQVIKHVTVYKDGKKEETASEKWIDCETGICLRFSETVGGGIPSETYNIELGPQPAEKFILPKDIKIIDVSAMDGLMGAYTGKSREENTKDVQNTMDAMSNLVEQLKKIQEGTKK